MNDYLGHSNEKVKRST